MNTRKIPVTVITGFLGAGKTTLVNRLLEDSAGRIGVIVNEFGEVGIDGELIVNDDNPLIEIRNGCVCCTVRTDLVSGVKTLLEQADGTLDRLIVETSGLADPAPVLQTFLADGDLLQRLDLEAVVTVVDAVNFQRQAGDDIAKEQIAFADLIVLNKASLLEREQLACLQHAVRAMNPAAAIVTTDHAKVPAPQVLGLQRFSLVQLLSVEPDILDGEHDHEHDDSIESCALQSAAPLDAERFKRWINQLVQQQGLTIMRTKGVLHFEGEARQFTFHSVHMLTEAKPGKRWPPGSARISRFVIIGRDLDIASLKRGFASCAVVPAVCA
ncbi:MAG TPA: GTP-binding protein [Oxalicibacterium sp.]|nr:GTP-binding protein [Oxalicibacterium sp.]